MGGAGRGSEVGGGNGEDVKRMVTPWVWLMGEEREVISIILRYECTMGKGRKGERERDQVSTGRVQVSIDYDGM